MFMISLPGCCEQVAGVGSGAPGILHQLRRVHRVGGDVTTAPAGVRRHGGRPRRRRGPAHQAAGAERGEGAGSRTDPRYHGDGREAVSQHRRRGQGGHTSGTQVRTTGFPALEGKCVIHHFCI